MFKQQCSNVFWWVLEFNSILRFTLNFSFSFIMVFFVCAFFYLTNNRSLHFHAFDCNLIMDMCLCYFFDLWHSIKHCSTYTASAQKRCRWFIKKTGVLRLWLIAIFAQKTTLTQLSYGNEGPTVIIQLHAKHNFHVKISNFWHKKYKLQKKTIFISKIRNQFSLAQ